MYAYNFATLRYSVCTVLCGFMRARFRAHARHGTHARHACMYNSAAEFAAARKVSKYEYSCLFMFQPVVLETLSPINKSAIRFMEDLGGRISAVSSEAREGVFLFQRLSALMQRFNAILVRDSFCTSDTSDLWSSQ